MSLLQEQFGRAWISPAVETELGQISSSDVCTEIRQAAEAGWLETRPVANPSLVSLLMKELHRGEAEAIALALELRPDWLLVDEREGREAARQLGLPLTGVLGILLRSKKARSLGGFFIDTKLESDVLKLAGE